MPLATYAHSTTLLSPPMARRQEAAKRAAAAAMDSVAEPAPALACAGGGHVETGSCEIRQQAPAGRAGRGDASSQAARAAASNSPAGSPALQPAPTLTTSVPASWMRAIRARARCSGSCTGGLAADSTGRMVAPAGRDR